MVKTRAMVFTRPCSSDNQLPNVIVVIVANVLIHKVDKIHSAVQAAKSDLLIGDGTMG
jgi:hypothetical protein